MGFEGVWVRREPTVVTSSDITHIFRSVRGDGFRSLSIIMITIQTVCHLCYSHSPPPPRIYSIAECTFPPVAKRALTFWEAFVKPMSCSCYLSHYISNTSTTKKRSIHLKLNLESLLSWPRIRRRGRRCTKPIPKPTTRHHLLHQRRVHCERIRQLWLACVRAGTGVPE